MSRHDTFDLFVGMLADGHVASERGDTGAKDANWDDRGGQTSWRQVSKPTNWFYAVWAVRLGNLVLKEPMARVAQLPPLTGLRGVAAYSVLLARTLNVSGVLSPSLTALA